jgi:F-type H+-transporting ATPase subunit b
MAHMSAAAVLLAAASEGGGGLTDINLALTLYTIVLFALFAFILAKFGWKPLLKIVEDREKSVRDAVASAEKANADAQSLLAEHRELVRAAARERDEVLKRTAQDAEALRASLAAKAKAESDQMIQRAKEQIEREKGAAIEGLRAEVADLAVEAAAKIIRSSLTPEVQRQLVDEFVAGLPSGSR